MKENGVSYINELDDHNLDSAWMTDSMVKSVQLHVGHDAGVAIEKLIYDNNQNSFVVDVGGNETAWKTMSAVGELRHFRHFDLIIIPVRDEGQDVDNAVKTIDAIRDHDANVRIAILLNDISAQTQNLDDLREPFAEVFDLVEEVGAELLVMPRIERYGRSRRLGKTQWEIAENRDAIIDKLETLAISAETAGDNKTAVRLSRLVRAVSGSRLARKWIDGVHERLDHIFGTDKKRLRIMVVSTKGGVGKSVCSQQLIATYLLSRFPE